MRRAAASVAVERKADTRCAIYTRKSSEEGLEQAFNSLHAQREACEAYIKSQRHEGWRALPALYDDGGISGGTLDRPALARLLDDIRAARVDLIVIYKVDRLTRSLADFAKLVDVFNERGVSFVSVTQQFNTATSMGRLTLNMLLSFAQFEREVTGERIRDKIAASKRKGMWMGGYPSLGYDVRDHKLILNEAEAIQVNTIFQAYVEVGSVSVLQQQLVEKGIVTKHRVFANGRTAGDKIYSRGNLYNMLQNPIYRGLVPHKGQVFPGEHKAIVDAALWDAVQSRLSENGTERPAITAPRSSSLLTGLLFDASGGRMTPSHATKNGKRYRYYVSRCLIIGSKAAHSEGQRIPAGDLDAMVITALRRLLATPSELHAIIDISARTAIDQRDLLAAAASLSARWEASPAATITAIVHRLVARVTVFTDRMAIEILLADLIGLLQGKATAGRSRCVSTDAVKVSNAAIDDARETYTLAVPASLHRAGKEMRLVIDGPAAPTNVDAVLARLIQQGIAFRNLLLQPDQPGIAELARRAKMSGSHFTRVLRLGFLSPSVMVAIAEGRQPPELTATQLLRDTRLPLLWNDQQKQLGFL